MENGLLNKVRHYFAGAPQYGGDAEPPGISRERFDALGKQFLSGYDDFYRWYYARYGAALDPVIAAVTVASVTFQGTYRHMGLCYVNAAISSGTNPHMDAIERGYHTTDRISRAISSTEHARNIEDSGRRSLYRAQLFRTLLPQAMIYNPTAFEAAARVVSKNAAITGGQPFDAADFMSFHNINIDNCRFFILDDPRPDTPSIDRVMYEIELAQKYPGKFPTGVAYERVPIKTSDWANSRNSIFEIGRGIYNYFGLNPWNPEGAIDIRMYDGAENRLYKPTLLDITKPLVQSILRWVPQGIAADTACTTVARIFNIHRMRTDPEYNAAQTAPLDMDRLKLKDDRIAIPSRAEKKKFDELIRAVEPFLLEYCPHLINPAGLPADYAEAQKKYKLSESDWGPATMERQKKTPAFSVKDLWPLTLADPVKPFHRFPARGPLPGTIVPQMRMHAFDDYAFSDHHQSRKEIWPDRPFDGLDEMSQGLAAIVLGALETGVIPTDSPEYSGLRFDLKRGALADAIATERRVHDLSLLPGMLGKEFETRVRSPNLAHSNELLNRLRRTEYRKTAVPAAAFGTPAVAVLNDAIKQVRPMFVGPGPESPPSDFRLAIEMEMLRRNYTKIVFQNGWETSDDSVRMMIQATKIEFGHIKRPGDNNNRLQVLAEDGHYISLYERYERLRAYVEKITAAPEIRRLVAARDSENLKALEQIGIRRITLGLARILEIYDCLNDAEHNAGRFEPHKMQPDTLTAFIADKDKIYETRRQTVEILKGWAWLWNPETDFADIPQHYLDANRLHSGEMAQQAGSPTTDDIGLTSEFG